MDITNHVDSFGVTHTKIKPLQSSVKPVRPDGDSHLDSEALLPDKMTMHPVNLRMPACILAHPPGLHLLVEILHLYRDAAPADFLDAPRAESIGIAGDG